MIDCTILHIGTFLKQTTSECLDLNYERRNVKTEGKKLVFKASLLDVQQ